MSMATIRKSADDLHEPSKAELDAIRRRAARQPDTSDISELSPDEIERMKPGYPLFVVIDDAELAQWAARNIPLEELGELMKGLIRQRLAESERRKAE